MMVKQDDIESKIYFHKYKPEKKIGEGSFGKIYSAKNIHTNEKYALKMENKESEQKLLESEAYVLSYLKGYGIPAVRSYGISGDYNIMIMELLHKSLEDLMQEGGGKFSLKTVCMLGCQMLERIEFIHNKHILHRDIKPDNFVMGVGENSHVAYVIDLGLAKKFRSSRTLEHIPFTQNKKLTGTARYASINSLNGCEQSRRDDLEAIGYVLMYFLKGSLPWQGLKIDRREDRYKKIYEKKKVTTAEELCLNFPAEFGLYVNYTRNLEFEQQPDYAYLKSLFNKVMSDKNMKHDYAFDWLKNENIQIPTISQTENIQAELRSKTVLRPLNTNNPINDPSNPIILDDHINIYQVRNESKVEEIVKIMNHNGKTEPYIQTQRLKFETRDNRDPNVYVVTNQNYDKTSKNINEERKQINITIQNGMVNNSRIDPLENKIKSQPPNLDINQNEILDCSKDFKKKKNNKCSIL